MDNEVRENVIFIPLTDEVIVSKDKNEVTVDSRIPPRGYTLTGSGWEVQSEDTGFAEWHVAMTCPLDKLDISGREAYLLETFFGKADIGFAVVFREGKKSWYMKLDFVGVGNYRKSIQRSVIMINGTAPYSITRFGSKVKIAGSVVKWADRHLYCDMRTKLYDKPTEEMTREELIAVMRRISDDSMTSINSRCRMIEEQWEVMRELVRRGLVKADDMQRVISEVTKTPPIKLPGRMTDDITLGTKERLYTDILLDIAGHERTLEAYERMLRDGTLPEEVCRMTIAAQKKMLEKLREELEKRRKEEKEDGV